MKKPPFKVQSQFDSANQTTARHRQELTASAIPSIIAKSIILVNPSLPNALTVKATGEKLPRRKECGIFSIREINHQTWVKESSRVSRAKTVTAYAVECNGHYLTNYSYLQNQPIREWGDAKDARTFDYIKDCEIAIANIVRENPNSLFDVLLYATKDKDGRIPDSYLIKYSHLLFGGWYLPLADADGNPIPYCQVKPHYPRTYFDVAKDKIKTIKYENPPETKAGALIPDIRDKETLDFIAGQIEDQYGVTLGKGFSSYAELLAVAKKEVPLLVTEGNKKVLALLGAGHLAIGLAGIWMFADDDKANDSTLTLGKVKRLKPILQNVFADCKEVCIAFDQDSNNETRQNVLGAADALKKSIQYGVGLAPESISILHWENSLGKGIDDLLANNFSLANTVKLSSFAVKRYKNLTALSNPDLTTSTRYLSQTIDSLNLGDKKVLGIKSRQGTGKSYAIARYIKPNLSNGTAYAVVLTHRESLSRVLAAQFGINYRTDTAQSQKGVSLCVDSLIEKYQGLNSDTLIDTLEASNQHLYLIIDEVHQVISHLLTAKTEIKKHRDQVILNLQKLIGYCLYGNGTLIVLDADLMDTTLDILANIAGLTSTDFRKACYIVNNSCAADIWEATVFDDIDYGKNKLSGAMLWKDTLLARAKSADKPIFVATTSQRITSSSGSIMLVEWLEAHLNKPVLRIDSETLNESGNGAIAFKELVENTQNCSSDDAENPAIQALQRFVDGYSVIVCSPSIETGVSIPATISFDSVFGYCGGNNALSNFVQSLCRVRFNCERFLFIKNHGISSEDRGLGISYREKIFNISKKNDNIRKTLEAAKYQVEDNCSLTNSNINFVECWAKVNEITDVGLLDPNAVTVNQLKEMGCTLSYFSLPETEFSETKKKIDTIKLETKTLKINAIFKKAQRIKEANSIGIKTYLELKQLKTISKTSSLEKQRFEYAEKFGDDLVSSDAGNLLIAGDIQLGIYQKLKNEYILRNPEIAKKLDLISFTNKTTEVDKALGGISDVAMVYRFLGIFDLIDRDSQISIDDEKVQSILPKWQKYQRDVATATGVSLPSDAEKNPVRAIGKLLNRIGYKFELVKKNSLERFYRVVRAFKQTLPSGTNSEKTDVEYITDAQIAVTQGIIAEAIADMIGNFESRWTADVA